MSTIASHSTLNILETVRDRGLVPKGHNRKWHMGYQMVTLPMTSRDLERSNWWRRSQVTLKSQMTLIRLECNISKKAGD